MKQNLRRRRTSHRVRSLFIFAFALPLLPGCSEEEPDAWGNFEATEVIVSAEAQGELLSLGVFEGDRLVAGESVGAIDATTVELQREELLAQRVSTGKRVDATAAQTDVLRAQLMTAQEEYGRIERLYNAQAATAQQLNQARGTVATLREQINAAERQTGAVRSETGGVDIRIRQIDERLSSFSIINPTSGTVLATYAEPGELVQPGRPLYKIANLDTLTLRAYISGGQLSSIRIGDQVEVAIDVGAEKRERLSGRVSWIASEAEFTPTPIQTREERVTLVYGVKVRVQNSDGRLKIGMPGELLLAKPKGGGDE